LCPRSKQTALLASGIESRSHVYKKFSLELFINRRGGVANTYYFVSEAKQNT
jgi:hypothetical protein